MLASSGRRFGRVGGNEEKKDQFGGKGNMKFVQRLFMGIGGMAAAAALLTTVSPKAHAVVATLVQVVNTRSTPVPNQDVDIPGRHPYQQSCVSGTFLCTMPAVPPNTELVIQTVSLTVIGSGSLNDVLFST